MAKRKKKVEYTKHDWANDPRLNYMSGELITLEKILEVKDYLDSQGHTDFYIDMPKEVLDYLDIKKSEHIKTSKRNLPTGNRKSCIDFITRYHGENKQYKDQPQGNLLATIIDYTIPEWEGE